MTANHIKHASQFKGVLVGEGRTSFLQWLLATLQTNNLSVVKYTSRMTSRGRFTFAWCQNWTPILVVFDIHRHYSRPSYLWSCFNAFALETCLQLSVYVCLVGSPMTVINDLTNVPSQKVSWLRLCWIYRGSCARVSISSTAATMKKGTSVPGCALKHPQDQSHVYGLSLSHTPPSFLTSAPSSILIPYAYWQHASRFMALHTIPSLPPANQRSKHHRRERTRRSGWEIHRDECGREEETKKKEVPTVSLSNINLVHFGKRGTIILIILRGASVCVWVLISLDDRAGCVSGATGNWLTHTGKQTDTHTHMRTHTGLGSLCCV